MNKKEIFEETNKEKEGEEGSTLMNHINSILEPFKEMGQIEWAVDMIVNTCDAALEPYRPHMHSKECRESRGPDSWECICEVNE